VGDVFEPRGTALSKEYLAEQGLPSLLTIWQSLTAKKRIV
jgi:hypothetical protein